MSQSGRIDSRFEGGVLTLTFDRPEKKNAFTIAMYNALLEAVKKADADPGVRVIVFTGAGDAFTAGNDLGDFMKDPPTSEDTPVLQLLLALVDVEKPIIAAVNGVAVGIGTTILLHTDIVYAVEHAKFKLPFVSLGLVPEGASSLLLPAIAGPARAAELLMFGEPFDAAKAKEVGLVSDVIPADRFRAYVTERARLLAEQPRLALKRTKRLLKDHHRDEIRQAIRFEAELFLRSITSPEAMEAFMAFFEKRKPDFSKLEAHD